VKEIDIGGEGDRIWVMGFSCLRGFYRVGFLLGLVMLDNGCWMLDVVCCIRWFSWVGMGWDGVGWDGVGWCVMGWCVMGWFGMGWDGMGWVIVGW